MDCFDVDVYVVLLMYCLVFGLGVWEKVVLGEKMIIIRLLGW